MELLTQLLQLLKLLQLRNTRALSLHLSRAIGRAPRREMLELEPKQSARTYSADPGFPKPELGEPQTDSYAQRRLPQVRREAGRRRTCAGSNRKLQFSRSI